MAYTKVHNPWHDTPTTDTPVDAAALNTIESGIAAAATTADSASTQISSLNTLVRSGTGTPEGVVTASVGTLFLRSDGSVSTAIYVKETGTGNTGWVAHPGGGGGALMGAIVGSNITALNAQSPIDGQLGIIRLGTWPNQHEVFLKWNAAQSKWIGEEIVLITQGDTWAMDLGNRSASQLVDWSLVANAVPFGKSFTTLSGDQSASSATLNVVSTLQGHGPAFTSSGVISIRDNIISYTAKTNTSFTGCTLLSGSGGTIPSTVDVTQGFPGGFGMVVSPVIFAFECFNAGLHLQEKLISFTNGSPEVGGGKALTIAPYWYQYNSGDGNSLLTMPPVGGIGFSATLVGSTDPGGTDKTSERSFTWTENNWSDWPLGSPTKRFLIPRIFGKMAAGSIDTGECLDTTLRVRWVG